MPAVESSVMTWVDYRAVERELDIVFSSGKTYTYLGVSPDVYRAFLAADSKGGFFLDSIKSAYPYAQRSRRSRFG